MERYGSLLIITLAFITAVCSYTYYAEHQFVLAQSMNEEQKETIEVSSVKKIKASHILVKTQEEAEQAKKEIAEGKSFESVAQEKSLCPSGKNGGDLGFFRRGQMVQEFEKAAFLLPVGKVSEPVATQFGWHLIVVTAIVEE